MAADKATLLSKAAAFIKPLEGFKQNPLWDYKQWTWGYGTYAGSTNQNLKPIGTITEAKASTDLIAELGQYYDKVNGLNISDNAKIALISFGFNEGVGNLNNLIYNLNRGYTLAQISDEMKLYKLAGGVVNAGLVDRRNKETKLLLTA